MKKEKLKGSTLLLAIVIISTVLFSGIGIGTIISRQTREMINISNEAVAFYAAESVASMMNKQELEEADCSGFDFGEKEVECEVEETAEGYLVTVRVGNSYYSFVKSGSSVETSEGGFYVYYYDHNKWEDIDIAYRRYSGGSSIESWNVGIPMSSSIYDNWKRYKIEDVGEIADEIRLGFAERGENISDFYYYIYKNNNAEDCFSTPEIVFSICE